MRFSSEQVKAIRNYVPGADLMIYLGNDDLPRAHYSCGGRFVEDVGLNDAEVSWLVVKRHATSRRTTGTRLANLSDAECERMGIGHYDRISGTGEDR